MKFEEFCTAIKSRLTSLSTRDERLDEVAKSLCRIFGTTAPNDIAIFSLDAGKEALTFMWPTKLRSAGTVPLSAMAPLVAKTVRENRGFVDNMFASTSHASIFEKFRIDGTEPLPIQKIMSVPLRHDGVPCGVIQISRKGEDAARAGKDFSQQDLAILQKVSDLFAVFL